MADGCHLANLPSHFRVIYRQWLDLSARNMAWWSTLALRQVRAVKISNF